MNRFDLVSKVVRLLASKLIKEVDPETLKALGYTPRRPHQEPLCPIVGFGVTNSDEEPSLAVLSHVPASEIDIPRVLEYEELPQVPFTVADVGDIYAAATLATASPVIGGDSIRMQGGPVGTLACTVIENASNNRLLLSCNHVIAGCNSGKRGTTGIFSPASSGTQIGTLFDFEKLNFAIGTSNTIDAAVSTVPVRGSGCLPGLRTKGPLKGSQSSPALNLAVEKEGASTGVTYGVLTIKNATLLVNLSGGAAVFDNQYAVTGTPTGLGKLGVTSGSFAIGGDSGAIVTDSNNEPIGMLFAVSTRLNQAYVNPIGPILSRFGVRIM